MSKSKSRQKKAPKRVLALPDLEHAKTAVLNSLTSASESCMRAPLFEEPSGNSRHPSLQKPLEKIRRFRVRRVAALVWRPVS